ncbi:hydrolase [Bombiscardovia nodaiensis]|uniref:Hydrolase n=1 Tax=Bombiscardovia nodaiensis TaxID=2932181 RepID=A0ABN6SBD0_9BIFI|nr:hydrolase [Bombiscardovia nodaiensis]
MDIVNHVLSQGQGLPLVLLHAFPIDYRMWQECAQELVRQARESGLEPFPIYAPDMPGAGDSPVPSAEQTGPVASDGAYPQALDRMTEAYAQWLKATGHERAIWVGLSMGGYLAAAMVRLHPQMVAGLALCDTTVAADTAQGRVNRLGVAAKALQTHSVEPVMHFAQAGPKDSSVKRSPECIETFTNWIQDQSPEGLAWRERMAAGRPDQSQVLAGITVPVAVVSGELDPSSPPAAMQTIVNGLTSTQASFTAIADCGHFSAVEHPDQVAAALLDLVRRVNHQ